MDNQTAAPTQAEIHEALQVLRNTAAPAAALELLDRWFQRRVAAQQRAADR